MKHHRFCGFCCDFWPYSFETACALVGWQNFKMTWHEGQKSLRCVFSGSTKDEPNDVVFIGAARFASFFHIITWNVYPDCFVHRQNDVGVTDTWLNSGPFYGRQRFVSSILRWFHKFSRHISKAPFFRYGIGMIHLGRWKRRLTTRGFMDTLPETLSSWASSQRAMWNN